MVSGQDLKAGLTGWRSGDFGYSASGNAPHSRFLFGTADLKVRLCEG